MRILIFWEEFLFYHISRISAAQKLASQMEHEIIPVAIRSGSPNLPINGYHSLLGNNVILLSNDPFHHSMQSYESAKQLLKILDDMTPEVVAIPGYDSKVNLAALWWCRKNHKGAILMSDSQLRDYKRSFWREIVKKSLIHNFDAAIVSGKSALEYITYLKMPSERVNNYYDVVNNTFWTDKSISICQDQNNWRRKLNLPEHFFLSSCRLVPKKNVAGLLRAFSIYIKRTPSPWPLIIMGDGPLRTELENLAHNLRVSDCVRFMGYLSPEQMAPVYALASIFVLASAYSEQWGLVVNEAMAAGLPVLVSNICGCVPDLIIEGVTGYSFNPTDEFELANLMTKCSSGEVDLRQLGQAAQDHIKNYSPEIFANNLLACATKAMIHAKTRAINI